MKKTYFKTPALVVSGLLSACASVVELPSNVALKPAPNGMAYIDKIEFSKSTEFAKEKLNKNGKRCLLTNVSNFETSLSDSSNSFIGQFTGNYYQIDKTQSVGGGDVIKASDKDAGFLAGEGTSVFSDAMINFTVRYTIVFSATETELQTHYGNIQIAQNDTGFASNNGFGPVGNWWGAKAEPVVGAINELNDKLEACILE